MTDRSRDADSGPDEVTVPPARLIVVGGAPRSGTTLLQNMLDSHPRIYGGAEFHHLSDFVDLRGKLMRTIDRGWIGEYCDARDVDEVLADSIRRLLGAPAARAGVPILSEKTPGNVLVFEDLLDLLPDAKFLFVVRDPRAVVSSLLKVGQRAELHGWDTARHTHDVRAAISFVGECMEAGFDALDEAPDRVHAVIYERLVRDPDAVTRELCEKLGIDWSERMLRPGDHEHPGEEDIVNDVWYRQETFRRNPDPSAIDKWRRELPVRRQIAVTAAFAEDARLRACGYELDLDHLTTLERVRGSVTHTVIVTVKLLLSRILVGGRRVMKSLVR